MPIELRRPAVPFSPARRGAIPHCKAPSPRASVVRPDPPTRNLSHVSVRVRKVDAPAPRRPLRPPHHLDPPRAQLPLPRLDVLGPVDRERKVRPQLRGVDPRGPVARDEPPAGGERAVGRGEAPLEEEEGRVAEGEAGHARIGQVGRAEAQGLGVEGDRGREVSGVWWARRASVLPCGTPSSFGRWYGGCERDAQRHSSRTCEILGRSEVCWGVSERVTRFLSCERAYHVCVRDDCAQGRTTPCAGGAKACLRAKVRVRKEGQRVVSPRWVARVMRPPQRSQESVPNEPKPVLVAVWTQRRGRHGSEVGREAHEARRARGLARRRTERTSRRL